MTMMQTAEVAMTYRSHRQIKALVLTVSSVLTPTASKKLMGAQSMMTVWIRTSSLRVEMETKHCDTYSIMCNVGMLKI